VHGDIRPENLISSLKLTNFFPLPFLLPPPSFYSSPQAFLKLPTKKSDIWSCGVLLYMILCGSLPFLAFSREGLEECVKKDDWQKKNEEWMEISGTARDLICKMLAVPEEERLSAEEALKHEW
jgi:serine/threonine protein kinase